MEKLEDDLDIPAEWKEHRLFRPPYGKMKRTQSDYLQTIYRLVMWDVITGDFDKARGPEKCLNTSVKDTRDGSIVIFHDSIKSISNLKQVLPQYLKHFVDKGYQFKTL
ncbi:MAG: polysaccharide deacetylase family protein, partial [Cytophagales bacterium]|nr:polysaccharide deacetylase family protein [Cytophaga sp.]